MRRCLAAVLLGVTGLFVAANYGRSVTAAPTTQPATVPATAPLSPAAMSAIAPTEAELTTALKAAWESPASGLNSAKTIEIKSIKISTVSRPWANPADVGSVGYQIWTARVHFLARTLYATRTVVFDYDYYFDLSVNTLGEWVVQTSSQAGSKRTALPDEPAIKK